MMLDDFAGGCDSVPTSIFRDYSDAVDCDDDCEPEAVITQSIERTYRIPPAQMRWIFIMRFQLIDMSWRVK